jgi:hypothetical protein
MEWQLRKRRTDTSRSSSSSSLTEETPSTVPEWQRKASTMAQRNRERLSLTGRTPPRLAAM